MLHFHISTVAQNGQTKRLSYRQVFMSFTFLSTTTAEGECVQLVAQIDYTLDL